jgi:hypothetical protein
MGAIYNPGSATGCAHYSYTADQMREYARAALAQPVPDDVVPDEVPKAKLRGVPVQPVPDAVPVATLVDAREIEPSPSNPRLIAHEGHAVNHALLTSAGAHPQPAPLTDEQVFNDEDFMTANGLYWGLPLTDIMQIVRCTERAHGIVPAPTTDTKEQQR